MFIPDYQIHNILKDFSQHLRNGHRCPKTGCQMETVVNKVARTIMRRVVHLSEEEALHRSRVTRQGGRRPLREPQDRPPDSFEYQTFDRDHGKQRRCFSVENSRILIERFQSVVDDDKAGDASGDEPVSWSAKANGNPTGE